MAIDKQRAIELIHLMHNMTVDKGCGPGEAANFAAKIAEWIEEFQISEAELVTKNGGQQELEYVQHIIRTGKKVHNPGMVHLVNGIALGSCCKCILVVEKGEAVIKVLGEEMDATYVLHISQKLWPELSSRAHLEGIEHGHEKAALKRWENQYLEAAGEVIRKRLDDERTERSREREQQEVRNRQAANGTTCTALKIVTGLTLAAEKRKEVQEIFDELYPKCKGYRGGRNSQYDPRAHEAGRRAGQEAGLHVGVGTHTPRLG